jgi:hypothetical protein
MAKKRTLTGVSLAKSLAAEALETDRDYRNTLKTQPAKVVDPLYRDLIALHNSLTPRQRKILADFARRDSLTACRRSWGFGRQGSGVMAPWTSNSRCVAKINSSMATCRSTS